VSPGLVNVHAHLLQGAWITGAVMPVDGGLAVAP